MRGIGNGTVVREALLDCDDQDRRLAWTIVDGPYSHHTGCAQVFAAGTGRTRFVWIAYVLPEQTAERTSVMMTEGVRIVKRTLETAPTAASAS